MTISEEMLMAYADGELDGPQQAAVESAMRENADLVRRIAQHRALREQVRKAYSRELLAAVPQRLLDTVVAASEGRSSDVINLQNARRKSAREAQARSTSATWRPWLSMAASVLIGVGVGYVLWQQSPTPFMRRADGGFVARGQLANALSHQLVLDQKPGSAVTIGLSFVAKTGEYCRTFALAGSVSASGLACREGADWWLRALDQAPGDAGGQSAYRTASSPISAGILQSVEAQIAGEPLDSASEKAALGRDWRRASR
jgi:hypothetical protein